MIETLRGNSAQAAGPRWLHRLWAAAALVLLIGLAAPGRAEPPLRFVALGDQPYGQDTRTGPAYQHLIELINAERPPFSIHVGDFKSGLTDCSNALYDEQLAYFNRYESALVYTPGDNDWTDCQRQHADPIERLNALRQRFFPAARSLGAKPIALERQSALMPAHAAYRENQRWWHQGVLFVTLHTVGPNDNASEDSAALRQEHLAREAANIAWVHDAFDEVRRQSGRALVFATQADVLKYPRLPFSPPTVRKGFRALMSATLLPLAQASPVPVLFIHGDSHEFTVDRPFVDEQGRRIATLWRLEVPGDARMHAVLVTVAPSAPQAFEFRLIWNPMSPDPR